MAQRKQQFPRRLLGSLRQESHDQRSNLRIGIRRPNSQQIVVLLGQRFTGFQLFQRLADAFPFFLYGRLHFIVLQLSAISYSLCMGTTFHPKNSFSSSKHFLQIQYSVPFAPQT